MKKYLFAIVFVVAAAALVYVVWPKTVHTTATVQTVTIGSTAFKVEVVDTESLRERGFSGHAPLKVGEGMLFVFDHTGNWGIWMKDMQFPLDIVWAREDGTVTTIARNVATSTYPDVFYPHTPDARYVLEISAGAAATVAEGMKMMVQ